MKKLSLILMSLSAAFLSFACSSGGRGYSRATYCASTDDFYNINKFGKAYEKTQIEKGQPFSVDQEYTLLSSAVYVIDKTQDVRFHIKQSIGADGKTKESLGCIAGNGISERMNPIVVDVPIVTRIDVADGGNRVRVMTQTMSIRFIPNRQEKWINYEIIETDPEYLNRDVVDVYTNASFDTASSYLLTLKNNETRHNLISIIGHNLKNDKTGKSRDSDLEVRVFVDFKSQGKHVNYRRSYK